MRNLKRKKIILLGLSVIIITALVILVILPTYNDVVKLKKDEYNKQVELKSILEEDISPAYSQKEFEELQQKTDIINQVFVKNEDTLSFITTLENIAENNHLEQTFSLPPEIDTGDNEIKEIPLTFTLKGTFADFIRYLQNIESENFYLNIESFNLSTAGTVKTEETESAPADINITLSTKSYWQ
ncbi:MAG: hypothetical protein ACD_12C00591G0004 [uncultured bacterium]|nr:MAG: hypothetical protein ACD_12C00591G0004 [uncultured bacterium]